MAISAARFQKMKAMASPETVGLPVPTRMAT
jgi:hypothetical protein